MKERDREGEVGERQIDRERVREREEVVVHVEQGGVDIESELRRAPWAYRLFGRVLVDAPWFLVNPRDRLQARRLVHFVSDTRLRRVIAQLLYLSASLPRYICRSLLFYPPSFSRSPLSSTRRRFYSAHSVPISLIAPHRR